MLQILEVDCVSFSFTPPLKTCLQPIIGLLPMCGPEFHVLGDKILATFFWKINFPDTIPFWSKLILEKNNCSILLCY